MAENKNSFIIYTDWKQDFEFLTDEEAGKLIKHLLRFASDENPTMENEDRLLQFAAQKMKAVMKKDLKKYEAVIQKRSEAGKKGGVNSGKSRTSKQEEANEANASISKQNERVNVNGNGNGNDILLGKESKEINLSDQVSDDVFQDDKDPDADKEKSCAKKEKLQPPDLENFLNYAQKVYQDELKLEYQPYDFAIRSKYQSWIDAGWKDGNKTPILNWKSKLKNTIPHLKPIYGKFNSKNTNNGFSNQSGNSTMGKSGKISAASLLAERARKQTSGDGSGGNFTT